MCCGAYPGGGLNEPGRGAVRSTPSNNFPRDKRWPLSRRLLVTDKRRGRVWLLQVTGHLTDGVMNPADVVQGAMAPVAAGGFSFIDLFLQAALAVKLVMIGLGLASIWSWAIIVEKLFAFRRARVESDKFESMFWSGQSLDELYAGLSRGRTITMAALFPPAHW